MASFGYNLITYYNKPKYFHDNVAKFYNNINKTIIFAKCGSFSEIEKDWDIYILLFRDTQKLRDMLKDKFKNVSPLYPIFDKDYAVLTRSMTTQIYELAPRCTSEDIADLYIYEMGAVLASPGLKIKKEYKRKKQVIAHKIRGVQNGIKSNNHIWCPLPTRFCIEYMVGRKSPTIIVELRSWLGNTTKIILDNAPKYCSVYCFDKFKNVAQSEYAFTKPHPLDKFWLTTPRYETFCRNIKDHVGHRIVYSVKHEAEKSIEFIRDNLLIIPEFVLIDSLTDTNKLYEFLIKLYDFSQDVAVVGDDYIDDSVKKAIEKFKKSRPDLNIYTTREKENVLQYVNKRIAGSEMYQITELMFDGKYSEVIKMLDQIDINKPYPEFSDNTFFTLLIIHIYSYGHSGAKLIETYILMNVDPAPLEVQNAVFLTWRDYKKQKITF